MGYIAPVEDTNNMSAGTMVAPMSDEEYETYMNSMGNTDNNNMSTDSVACNDNYWPLDIVGQGCDMYAEGHNSSWCSGEYDTDDF